MQKSGDRETFIVCRNSQGVELRATLLRMTRYLVVFEVYNPYSILQLSEVLSDFKIFINDQVAYSGRAIVSNLVNTGILIICEAALEDSWLDVGFASEALDRSRLRTEFEEFIREWEKIHRISGEFKIVIADMQNLLLGLRRWLEQVELLIRSEVSQNRLDLERNVIHELQPPMLPIIGSWFGRFDDVSESIPEDLQPAHRAYARRQLHPLVLCSPFVYRTFSKPLGYAGDYEMVNMILRDPFEGGSLFAKIVNNCFLQQPPAEAHRNRIRYLLKRLGEETRRRARLGKTARIFNLGCGPAKEIQEFLVQDDLCERAQFTLLDFNDETLAYTGKLLDEIKMRSRRMTPIQMIKKSVHQILKECARPASDPSSGKYDFIYCAGLFDYLSDRICKRLMDIFYDMLAPGGLLVATNVDASKPFRHSMEYILEWHLVCRNEKQLQTLSPELAPEGAFLVNKDVTGVNVFLEVRKPESA